MDKLTRQRTKAGKLGGSVTSRAKTRAAKANATLGGRPAKLDPNVAAHAIVAAAERLTQQPARR